MSIARKEKEVSPQGTGADPDGTVWAPARVLSARALPRARGRLEAGLQVVL